MPLFGNFDLFTIFFFILFFSTFGFIVINYIRGIRQWGKNNHSPKLTVPVTVVTKRTNVTGRRSHGSTTYYVTFQVESGDRMEFLVTGYDYGMLVEGDRGDLTFQGTRFLGFVRN